jgi:RimJ/RimL family protein N-acetyltransferase
VEVPVIETPRLRLRGWEPEDVDALAAINADPRVGEWLGGVIDRDRTEARIQIYAYHWEEHDFGLWAVEELETGRLVGRTGFMHWDDWTASPHDAEIGWTYVPAVWGRGFATEAARASLDWGFDRAGLEEIVSFAMVENAASLRVMEKLSMSYDRDFLRAGLPHSLYRIRASDVR